eukprot:6186770-Pleurochrysis_carterae.AAC.7
MHVPVHARARLSSVSRTTMHANVMLRKGHAHAALSLTKNHRCFRAGAHVQQALERSSHLLSSARCTLGRCCRRREHVVRCKDSSFRRWNKGYRAVLHDMVSAHASATRQQAHPHQ